MCIHIPKTLITEREPYIFSESVTYCKLCKIVLDTDP